MQAMRIAACLLLTIYAAVAAGMFAFQRTLVFAPDTARPDAASIGIPTLRTITLTADGLPLLAWYIPPPANRPVIAYFHGNGGNLADRRDRLRLFAAAGFGVLLPEYPGYGGNPGTPSQAGFDATAQAAMAFLQAQAIAAPRIAIYGESIGTAVATTAAATHATGALILESPFTSVTAIAQRRFPFLPVSLLIRDPFDQISHIGQVHAPILVLQGTRDTIVPPDLGRRLFDAAPQPKTLWIAPEAGHTDLFAHGALPVVLAFAGRLAP